MWHSTSIHTLKSRTILSIFSHGNIRMKLKFFIQVNGCQGQFKNVGFRQKEM